MLNSVAIMGRFAADPELKHTPSGVAVTSFTLAVDRNYAKPGEERQTDWIDVVAWRGTAEFICKYFTKGRMIAVTGSLQTRVWEDKNGSKHKATDLVAQQVSFCGTRQRSQVGESLPDKSRQKRHPRRNLSPALPRAAWRTLWNWTTATCRSEK